MRIIAKNHDYYDGIMKYGFDPSIIFERKPEIYDNLEEFDKDLEEHLSSLFDLFKGCKCSVKPFAVIFCGKIYLGIKITVKKKCECQWHCTCGWYDSGYTDIYCYNAKEAIKTLEEDDIDADYELSGRILIDGKFVDVSPEKRVELFFENSNPNKFVTLMIDRKCPILLVENAHIYSTKLKAEKNAVLKNVKFFKVFDPYTTYQNLSMFIDGVLTKEANPTVEISDKDMVIKKGFDKWSFRKMKGD